MTRHWNLLTIVAATMLSVPMFSLAQSLEHPLNMKLPASDFSRPDPSDYQFVLDNGLVAYIASADQVPLVTLSAFIRAGTVSDEKQGTAEALREALLAGGLPASEFAEALRFMTAEYSIDMHEEWTEITMNVPSEDLGTALKLFAGVISAPRISERAIEKAMAGARESSPDLAAESGPALYEGSLAKAVSIFEDILFADHAYNTPATRHDLAQLSVEDVSDFHQRFFVPTNMTLSIAGHFENDSVEAAIAQLFAALPDGSAPEPTRQAAIVHEDSPVPQQHWVPADKLQSWLVFGHELPVVPVEDQAALEVMNYILAGGHLYTRMTVETRYRYGYTNDASGFLDDHWYGPGTYTFRSYSRPEVIEPLYDNMMAEILRILDEPVSDEEMFIAKGALTDGSFPIRYLDGYAIARNLALERLRYGNHQRSANYVARIKAVSKDDVMQAANKFLHPEKMHIVLLGHEQDLLD